MVHGPVLRPHFSRQRIVSFNSREVDYVSVWQSLSFIQFKVWLRIFVFVCQRIELIKSWSCCNSLSVSVLPLRLSNNGGNNMGPFLTLIYRKLFGEKQTKWNLGITLYVLCIRFPIKFNYVPMLHWLIQSHGLI